jgi:hypothetical protein
MIRYGRRIVFAILVYKGMEFKTQIHFFVQSLSLVIMSMDKMGILWSLGLIGPSQK